MVFELGRSIDISLSTWVVMKNSTLKEGERGKITTVLFLNGKIFLNYGIIKKQN